jgi:hypothetical protein
VGTRLLKRQGEIMREFWLSSSHIVPIVHFTGLERSLLALHVTFTLFS